ncbi:MAG: tRNA epoxyqueuosine(34) reductase QueG, partial [Gaiellaceae bacterium]
VLSATAISELIKHAAAHAGFELSGIAPVREFSELEYFPEWIAAGHGGEMRYLESRGESGRLKRASLADVAPWAKSVIVCGLNYNVAQPKSIDTMGDSRPPTAHGWISRYAWSAEDYHDSVMRRLRQVEVRLKQADQECDTRCYVDTGPLVERVWAKYAGLGWQGKNTCIINQQVGSWIFLGVIVTSIELEPDLPAPDRCGTCTLCLDACPTGAFIAPHELDATRCISYLTIEKRGDIPADLRDGIGRHVFGCDICQDVCPWNRGVEKRRADRPVEGAEPHVRLADWLRDESDAVTERYDRLYVPRNDARYLRRNALVALGNVGSADDVQLAQPFADGEDSMLQEQARWTITRLEERSLGEG